MRCQFAKPFACVCVDWMRVRACEPSSVRRGLCHPLGGNGRSFGVFAGPEESINRMPMCAFVRVQEREREREREARG